MHASGRGLLLASGVAMIALMLVTTGALAAPHNPFAVAGNEGSVNPTRIGGWLLGLQTHFYKLITGTVRAAKSNGSAVWTLAGISFGYGVFHAAGPGHGKAVVASYMVANERALKRGLVISFLAALLQGLVAIAIVSIAALVLRTTAARITQATDVVELLSYAGVAILGAWLVWRKGGAFFAALRARKSAAVQSHGAHVHDGHGHADHGHEVDGDDGCWGHDHAHSHRQAASVGAAAVADPVHRHAAPGTARLADHPGHVHDEHCGHFHAPDPTTLGDGFSWRTAALTVFSAGARPCSGAILVLVFALAQGIFLAGIAATFAMSLGTAITTGLLAATAVLFKGVAVRMLGRGSARRELIARGVEVLAAFAVLLVGVGLLLGTWGMAAGA